MNSKKIFTSTAVATAVAAGTYFLGKEENREKIMHNLNRVKSKLSNSTKEDYESYYDEKMGYSDPEDISDNKMVGEGSTYAVKYYNEKEQGNEDEKEEPS